MSACLRTLQFCKLTPIGTCSPLCVLEAAKFAPHDLQAVRDTLFELHVGSDAQSPLHLRHLHLLTPQLRAQLLYVVLQLLGGQYEREGIKRKVGTL